MQFAGERFSHWATESNLRRSIQSCLNHTPQETSEYFWQLPETKSLARQHLIAYLQEPCYWVSQKTVLISSVLSINCQVRGRVALQAVGRLRGY